MSLDIWQKRPLRAKNACGRCSGKGGIQVRFASGAHYKTTCPCCNGTGQRLKGACENKDTEDAPKAGHIDG